MTAAQMRIGVTNAVLSNTGDAAIFQAIKDALEGEFGPGHVNVVAFDSHAPTTRLLYPDWEIYQQPTQLVRRTPAWAFRPAQYAWTVFLYLLSMSPGMLRAFAYLARRSGLVCGRSLGEVSRCDAIVSSGGTYLVDHYNFLHRAVELTLAKRLGKPVVLWTQSMGPFRNRASRRHLALLSRSVDAAFFRDPRSAEAWADAAGRPVDGGVAPDAVFGIDPPRGSVADPDVRQVTDGHPARPRAALSVRAWSRGVNSDRYDRAAYLDMMRGATAVFDAAGWESRAVSTCQGVPSYAYDDAKIADEVFAGQPVLVDHEFHSPNALMQMLTDTNAVVATRMHLAILGLMLGRPVIGVAYEFKTVELFTSLGLEENVIVIEESSVGWMRDTVRRMIDHPGQFTLDAGLLEELRAEARRPAQMVRGLLLPAVDGGQR